MSFKEWEDGVLQDPGAEERVQAQVNRLRYNQLKARLHRLDFTPGPKDIDRARAYRAMALEILDELERYISDVPIDIIGT